MGAEILMSGIKDRKLQRIDHASYGVYHTACQKPSESGRRKSFHNRHKGKQLIQQAFTIMPIKATAHTAPQRA